MIEVKLCNICKEEKPLSEFYNDKTSKFGKRTQCKLCKNAITSQWHKDNPKKSAEFKKRSRIRQMERNAGLGYTDLLVEQNGVCAICKQLETVKTKAGVPLPLSWDHHHKSGRFRGLLCGNCNRMLGLSHEDIEILEGAAQYLKKWKNNLNL